MQILAFGDSITNGSHVSVGWADQLRSFLFEMFQETDPDNYPRMYNLGIPGNTTDDLIKRFSVETEARIRGKYGAATFLFSFGSNDAATLEGSSEYVVNIEKYKSNLHEVLEKATKYTGHIAFLTAPPVVEGKPNPNAKNRLNVDIERYNAVLFELATEYKTDVIDVYAEFQKQEWSALLNEDGIHPNPAGHEVILRLVKEYLVALL